MKESYVKPQIYFEDFTFSQTIARGCGDTHSATIGESTHYDEHTCGWKMDEDTTLFLLEAYCDFIMEEDDEIEGFCYNGPSGDVTIFSSK